MKRWIVAFLLVLACSVDIAHAGNASQNTVDNVNCSGTLAATATWQLAANVDKNRAKMLLQNVGATNLGFALQPYSATNVAPTAVGIGSAGVWTLLPFGSYEPDGGWIDGGALWVIGTIGAAFTCQVSVAPSP